MTTPAIISADLDGLSAEDRAAYDAFVAIADPARRAEAITAWGRPRGNLRPPFTQLRLAALAELRARASKEGRKLGFFARKVGLSPSRFSRLAKSAVSLQPATSEGAQP